MAEPVVAGGGQPAGISAGVPLAGARVVTTRGASADDRLGALLEAAGARVVAWPTCEYPPPRDPGPLKAALARLGRFDWVVFTSARAVRAVGARVAARAPGPAGCPGGEPAGGSAGSGVGGSAATASPAADMGPALPPAAVVGPATARAAAGAGWTVAARGRGPGARGLAARVAAAFPLAGARVLFPAASRAASTVEDEFAALGARVTRVEAYRTVVAPPPASRVRADLAAGVDAVTFASPSAVEAVDRALGGVADSASAGEDAPPRGEDIAPVNGYRAAVPAHTRALARALDGVAVVCIGPTTAAALAARGVAGVRMAAAPTLEGMVKVLVDWLGGMAAGATPGGAGAGENQSRPGGRVRTSRRRPRAPTPPARRSPVVRA